MPNHLAYSYSQEFPLENSTKYFTGYAHEPSYNQTNDFLLVNSQPNKRFYSG